MSCIAVKIWIATWLSWMRPISWETRDRGVVWEEILIYLPVRVNVLLLSATIGNAPEIAAWLTSLRTKACIVIREEKRSVPLYPLFLHPPAGSCPIWRKIRFLPGSRSFTKISLKTGSAGKRFPISVTLCGC